MKSSEKEIRYVRLSSLTRTFEVSNRRSAARPASRGKGMCNTRQWGLYNDGPVWRFWPKWPKIDLSSFFSAILSTDRVVHRIHKIISLWKNMAETWVKLGVTLVRVERMPHAAGWPDWVTFGQQAPTGRASVPGSGRRIPRRNVAGRIGNPSYCQTRTLRLASAGRDRCPTPAGRGQSTMAPDRDRGPGRSARPVVLVSALGGLSPRAVFVSIVNERAIDRGPFQTGPGARHLVFRAAAAGASPVRTQTAFPIASRVPIPPVIPLLSITIYSEMPCGVGNILPAARERSRGGPRLPKRVRNARTKNAACQNGSWLPFAAGLQFPASVKAAAKETGNTPGLRLPRGSLRLSLHRR